MSVNGFDVLKRMGERERDVRLAPLDMVLRMQKVRAGTQVTIGVEGDVIAGISSGRFVGGLILANREQFEATKRELEAEVAGNEAARG